MMKERLGSFREMKKLTFIKTNEKNKKKRKFLNSSTEFNRSRTISRLNLRTHLKNYKFFYRTNDF